MAWEVWGEYETGREVLCTEETIREAFARAREYRTECRHVGRVWVQREAPTWWALRARIDPGHRYPLSTAWRDRETAEAARQRWEERARRAGVDVAAECERCGLRIAGPYRTERECLEADDKGYPRTLRALAEWAAREPEWWAELEALSDAADPTPLLDEREARMRRIGRAFGADTDRRYGGPNSVDTCEQCVRPGPWLDRTIGV